MSLPHVCLYVCSCVHGTAETLDGVEEWPDTQTSQQTDVNETYFVSVSRSREFSQLWGFLGSHREKKNWGIPYYNHGEFCPK